MQSLEAFNTMRPILATFDSEDGKFLLTVRTSRDLRARSYEFASGGDKGTALSMATYDFWIAPKDETEKLRLAGQFSESAGPDHALLVGSVSPDSIMWDNHLDRLLAGICKRLFGVTFDRLAISQKIGDHYRNASQEWRSMLVVSGAPAPVAP